MSFKTIDPNENPSKHNEVWDYVYERDNGTCQICGQQGTEQHHLLMKSKGGDNRPNNLVLLCAKCHKYTDGGHTFDDNKVERLKKRVEENEKKFRRRMI